MSVARVVVISGGSISEMFLKEHVDDNDIVIAADNGIISSLEAGITPHVAIGDFDTAGKDRLEEWILAGIEVISLPKEKDVTDTHAALEYALRYQPDEIYLYGAFGGGRIDHTLANIALLEWLDIRKVKGYIQDETNRMQLIRGPEQIALHHSDFPYISLLPLSGHLTGVTTSGLVYPLHEASLIRGDSLGISNQITAEVGHIHVHQGLGLIIESRDA